jgi:hypothetical protein
MLWSKFLLGKYGNRAALSYFRGIHISKRPHRSDGNTDKKTDSEKDCTLILFSFFHVLVQGFTGIGGKM